MRILAVFNGLPLAKIPFCVSAHPALASVICVPEYILYGQGMVAIWLRHFDLVTWLNTGRA
jgi:hypothetical protein